MDPVPGDLPSCLDSLQQSTPHSTARDLPSCRFSLQP
uniref:Uncharacterized protein n=1 Tax=Anguilla anguilla TaxID=7936 RepID=A0A0E9U3V0_ANGAN